MYGLLNTSKRPFSPARTGSSSFLPNFLVKRRKLREFVDLTLAGSHDVISQAPAS